MVLQWKFSGNRPVYIQIMEHVRGAILVGALPPGGRIPPVRELASQAQVNPNTMQRALLELEREGLLIAQGALGRFVTKDPEILQTMRQAALDAVIRECAAQCKAAGLTMEQAASMLLCMKSLPNIPRWWTSPVTLTILLTIPEMYGRVMLHCRMMYGRMPLLLSVPAHCTMYALILTVVLRKSILMTIWATTIFPAHRTVKTMVCSRSWK